MVPNSLQCLPYMWTEADLLQNICDTFVESTGLKLAYKGDSMASVAHRAFEEYEITQRLHIADRAYYVERQEGRCEACGETFEETDKVELHHRLALAQGGTNSPDNLVLLHAMCHAAETQLQELSGLFTPFHTVQQSFSTLQSSRSRRR